MRFSTAAAAAALVLAPVSLAGKVNRLWPRELQKIALPRSVPGNTLDVSASMLNRRQRNADSEGGRGNQQGSGGRGGNKNGNGQRKGNNRESEGRGGGGGGGRNNDRESGGRNEREGGRGSVQREGGRGANQGTAAPVIIIWTNQGNGAAREQVNEKVTVTETVTAGQTAVNAVSGAAATQTIKVGGPGGLVYSPPNIQMPVGGTVVWEFLSQNHTVTQSSFAKPCEKLEGGFETGFMPNPNNTVNPPPQVAMQVMTDEPLWFKCSQGKHCAQGMVASINAKDGEKSHAAFQELAIKSGGGAAAATNSTGSAAKEAPKGMAKEAAKDGAARTTSAFRSSPTSSMVGMGTPAAEAGAGWYGYPQRQGRLHLLRVLRRRVWIGEDVARKGGRDSSLGTQAGRQPVYLRRPVWQHGSR
ncbi:hypothetical protein HIM_01563 [Hirsutella minnesotensis 3608]|nr:hypothetical protein HIM_01563 [Hirsutella minnesotensis 3608]